MVRHGRLHSELVLLAVFMPLAIRKYRAIDH